MIWIFYALMIGSGRLHGNYRVYGLQPFVTKFSFIKYPQSYFSQDEDLSVSSRDIGIDSQRIRE